MRHYVASSRVVFFSNESFVCLSVHMLPVDALAFNCTEEDGFHFYPHVAIMSLTLLAAVISRPNYYL